MRELYAASHVAFQLGSSPVAGRGVDHGDCAGCSCARRIDVAEAASRGTENTPGSGAKNFHSRSPSRAKFRRQRSTNHQPPRVVDVLRSYDIGKLNGTGDLANRALTTQCA